MKSTFLYLQTLALMAMLLASCTKEEVQHETTLLPFGYSFADTSVNIKSDNLTLAKSLTLKWEKTKAADYSTVFYQVLFSKNSDFSGKTFALVTNHLGTDNFAKITYQKLNEIAEAVGIKPESTGELKWKIRASTGISFLVNNEIRTITVTRPSGFALFPDEVFLLGTATKAGEVPDSAITMKKVDDGIFEAFAHLSEGTFYFMDKNTVGNRVFGFEKDSLLVEDGQKMNPINKDKIHRIRLDFNRATISISEIQEIGLWYSPASDVVANLTQTKATQAQWTVTTTITFANADYRYKFRMKEKKANGSTSYLFWGPASKSVAPATNSTIASYYFLNQVDDSPSNYCYKFNTSFNKKNIRINVNLMPENDNYNHSVSLAD